MFLFTILFALIPLIITIFILNKVVSIDAEVKKMNRILVKIRDNSHAVPAKSQNVIDPNSSQDSVGSLASASPLEITQVKITEKIPDQNTTIPDNIPIKTYEVLTEPKYSSMDGKRNLDNSFELFASIRKNFLIKLGSLFLILGFGWFMTFAISNQWINPPLQILIAFVIGSGIIVLGTFMSSSNSSTSSNQVFILTGSIINVSAFFIASNFYQLISNQVALFAIFVNILIVGTLACFKNYRILAYVFQLALFLVPFINSSTTNDFTFLGYYGLVIIALSLGVNFWKHWSGFNTTGLFLSFIYGAFTMFFGTKWFTLAYVLIYFLVNLVPVYRFKKSVGLDLFNVGASTCLSIFLLLGYSYDELTTSLLLVGYGVITAFITFLFTNNSKLHTFALANLVGSLFSFGIAAFLFFGFASITTLGIVAFLILAGVCCSRLVSKSTSVPRTISLCNLILIPMGYSFLQDSYFYNFNLDPKSMVVLFGVYTLFGLLTATAFKLSKPKDYLFSLSYYSITGLCAMVFVWFFCSVVIGSYGIALSLFIYAIVGLVFLYNSYFTKQKGFNIAANVLLGFTIIRLFLVDFWLMEMPVRIVIVIALGVMFLGTAFLTKKQL